MDWRLEVKHDLQNYQARKASIQNITDELARLEAEFTGIKSATSDGTPVSGGTNHREDRLLNNIVKRGKLEGNRRSTLEWVRIMERGLRALNDDERFLLDRLYINGSRGSAEPLAEELGIEVRTLWYQVNKALSKLAYAMYGQLTS